MDVRTGRAGWLSKLFGQGEKSARRGLFARSTFLLDTHVAGTTHIPGIEKIAGRIRAGDRLCLEREPGNPYDGLAIRVCTRRGVKIGYVPREDNAVLARLLDGGAALFARVARKEKKGAWIKVSIRVFMRG